MSDDFSNATDALKHLFDRLMPENSSGYSGLFSGWEEIAGPDMSMHVAVVDVVNKSLILEADHPGWIQKTRMMQSRILKEVNDRYPELEISRLRITVGNGRKKPVSRPDTRQVAPVVEKEDAGSGKTLSVASGDPFHELLEKMRRRGES